MKDLWQWLVHVCRRWRYLVFGSPRRLNLRLRCTPETSTRDTLDVWPALPLTVQAIRTSRMDNVVAALGQNNRVCRVHLEIHGGQTEEVLAAMQVPFPELTELQLSSFGGEPVIPDSFLGGSAPRLQVFDLSDIPFPGLPNLLLSATHLVDLRLSNIPHPGYISPEAMVALLSILSSLKNLSLGFPSPQSRPGRESRNLRPPQPSTLPVLSYLHFEGVTEYLEDLVTSIDTPQLDHLHIKFLNSSRFDCPRLAQFIDCTPALRALDEVHVGFDESEASLKIRYRSSKSGPRIRIIIPRRRRGDLQLSFIKQVCNSFLHTLSTVEGLYIEHQHQRRFWKNDATENNLWLGLLLPFTAVKNIHLSAYEEFAPGIVTAMRELVGARKRKCCPTCRMFSWTRSSYTGGNGYVVCN